MPPLPPFPPPPAPTQTDHPQLGSIVGSLGSLLRAVQAQWGQLPLEHQAWVPQALSKGLHLVLGDAWCARGLCHGWWICQQRGRRGRCRRSRRRRRGGAMHAFSQRQLHKSSHAVATGPPLRPSPLAMQLMPHELASAHKDEWHASHTRDWRAGRAQAPMASKISLRRHSARRGTPHRGGLG